MAYGRKRSFNRAFGTIAAHRFYGRPGSGGHKQMSYKSKGAKRVKSGYGSSKSRTISKKGAQQPNDSYGGGCYSYTKLPLGPKKGLPGIKGTAPLIVQSNSATSSLSPVGQQFLLIPNATCSRSSMEAWQTIIQNNMRQQIGNVPGTGFADVKVHIKYVSTEYRFMNMTVRPIQIQIYDYVFKRDSLESLNTMFGSVSNFDAAGNIATGSWKALSSSLPGWKPSDSSAMNQFIKIVKSKKIWLQAGETHVHIINARYNRSWNAGIANAQVGDQLTQFKGWTYGCFALGMAGLSVGDANAPTPDIGRAECGVYTIERAHIRPAASYALPQTQQYSGVVATSGVEEFVDEVFGGVWKEGTGILAATSRL